VISAGRNEPRVFGPDREHRWTCGELSRLFDSGFFFRRRVELVGGRLVDAPEQTPSHAAGVGLALNGVTKSFGENSFCRPLCPLHIDHRTLVKPDIAVVTGAPRDYVTRGHPKSALLIVEISDSTLRYDRQTKGPRYARAQYQDYWIVNLIDRCVEVYRKPMADPSAKLGWRYADVSILKPPTAIKPIAAAGEILIADLLP
jgi:Putative restriction endonuclease